MQHIANYCDHIRSVVECPSQSVFFLNIVDNIICAAKDWAITLLLRRSSVLADT
jgi:hypothetical protein